MLLSNHNVLRGNAIQHGNEIIVRRNDGSELHLDRKRVLCWGNSVQDLYRFRIDQRQKNDLTAYLADIQWCLRHELIDPTLLQIASRDLQEAQQFAPRDRNLARLAIQLHRQLVAQQSQANPIQQVSQADRQAVAEQIQMVDHQQELARAEQDFDRDTLSGFARDVQPMLLNRCGSCHGHQSDLAWRLLLPAKGSRASARMTRQNLVATAKYLNFDEGLESELRIRAMDGHAGEQHALSIRETGSTRAFERWLQHARPAGDALDIAKRRLNEDDDASETQSFENPDAHIAHKNPWASDESSPHQSDKIERLPQVSNPFDPEIFNRRQQLR
ncbi:MAG: hypothetical protein WBD20_26610 [Pirellulaceae bacterium]